MHLEAFGFKRFQLAVCSSYWLSIQQNTTIGNGGKISFKGFRLAQEM